MNKSSVISIMLHINKIVTNKGEGFYCTIANDNTVFDVFHASIGEEGISFQILGVEQAIRCEYLADTIYDEKVVVNFVYLNDILSANYKGIPDNA
jgi:hypothetical protein